MAAASARFANRAAECDPAGGARKARRGRCLVLPRASARASARADWLRILAAGRR